MIDKILAFFGYKIIEINLYNKIKTEVEELGIKVSALEKDFAEKVSLFEKPGIEPEISFTDFQKALTTDNGYSPWQLYWKKYYAGAYLAWYLRQISLSPDFVANFLFKFSTFDWNGTATYMKQANWTWSNNKVTPSAQDLQQEGRRAVLRGNISPEAAHRRGLQCQHRRPGLAPARSIGEVTAWPSP